MASRGRLLGRKLRQPLATVRIIRDAWFSKQSAGKQTNIVPFTQFVLKLSEVRPGLEARISSDVLCCVILYMLIVRLSLLTFKNRTSYI